jgi:predicted cupin superfamily sugar epimerase
MVGGGNSIKSRRDGGGSIVVVVTPRDFSAMHRLKTDEVWHSHSGSPLEVGG